jgi:hypothetical protein
MRARATATSREKHQRSYAQELVLLMEALYVLSKRPSPERSLKDHVVRNAGFLMKALDVLRD